jgi:hypothetical protein
MSLKAVHEDIEPEVHADDALEVIHDRLEPLPQPAGFPRLGPLQRNFLIILAHLNEPEAEVRLLLQLQIIQRNQPLPNRIEPTVPNPA